MNIRIEPSQLRGKISAIASKSCAHRMLICAALSDKASVIECRELSDDIRATAECLSRLCADIEYDGRCFAVNPFENRPVSAVIDCGESGSTLRFLLPVISALGIDCKINMHGRLPLRPLSPLYEELVRAGAVMSEQGSSPLHISGSMSSRSFSIAGNVSSQFISGLLLALPVIGGGEVNITSKLESASYVNITLDCLRRFGIETSSTESSVSVSGRYTPPEKLTVEGDWSNAAFWLCAGALGTAPIAVSGLELESPQGDRKILDILSSFGADIALGDAITVSPSKLHAADIDASDIPDLVPVSAVLAARAQGTSRIYNAGRLRLKESDRLKTVTLMLTALGADIFETEDGLIINGGKHLSGGCVSSCGDHRIAMSAAVASLLCDNAVTIEQAEAVNKSYPRFFDDYSSLGGVINEQI